MKKAVFAFGMFMAAGMLSACSAGDVSRKEKSLYEHGLDLIAVMDEMTENHTYTKTFSVSGEIEEIINEIAEGDYRNPDDVFEITISDENLDRMVSSLNGGGGMDEMSEELKENLRQKMFASVMTQLNGRSGAKNLAAASICTAGKSFVSKTASNDIIYFYVYDDAQPVAVTFIHGEDGAVNATATFVLYEDLKDAIMIDLEMALGDMGANKPV